MKGSKYIIPLLLVVIAFVSYYTLKKTNAYELKLAVVKAQTQELRTLVGKALIELDAERDRVKTRKNARVEQSPYEMKQDYDISGALDAELTMIVYTDPECVYCKKFHGKAQSVAEMSGGAINVQTVLIPLINKDDVSFKETSIIECAGMYGGSYMFDQYLDQIMKSTMSNGIGSITVKPQNISAQIDRNITKCVNAGIATDKIAVNLKKAKESQVKMTPTTVVINNKTKEKVILNGAVDTKQLLEVIAAFNEKKIGNIKESGL